MDLNHICIVIDDTLLHLDNICSDHNETDSLSQTQELAVLKDAELSPPAASAASAAPTPARQLARRAGLSLLVPAARLQRRRYPPPAQPQMSFKKIPIILQITAIIANNLINRARIDTVAALMQST